MKNFFLMIALLAVMTACGGGKQAENTDNANDSTTANNTENAEGKTNDEAKTNEAQYGKLMNKEEVGKAKEYTSIAEVEGEADKSTIIRYRPKDYPKEFPTPLLQAKNLQVLVLQGYKAATLPEEIKTFQNLTLLYLSGANQLEKLPEAIGELKNLKTISLEGCRKLDINQVLSVLKNCPNLENLSLSYLPFTEMPATISELKNLKLLKIKNNKFKILPDELYTLENLKYLAMGSSTKDRYNYEEIFKKMKALPKLETLFIPYSGLKGLPDVMKEYPALKKVVWRESDWKDAKADAKKWSDKFPNFDVTWSTQSTPMYYFY